MRIPCKLEKGPAELAILALWPSGRMSPTLLDLGAEPHATRSMVESDLAVNVPKPKTRAVIWFAIAFHTDTGTEAQSEFVRRIVDRKQGT